MISNENIMITKLYNSSASTNVSLVINPFHDVWTIQILNFNNSHLLASKDCKSWWDTKLWYSSLFHLTYFKKIDCSSHFVKLCLFFKKSKTHLNLGPTGGTHRDFVWGFRVGPSFWDHLSSERGCQQCVPTFLIYYSNRRQTVSLPSKVAATRLLPPKCPIHR
jgi:hypothetical protein